MEAGEGSDLKASEVEAEDSRSGKGELSETENVGSVDLLISSSEADKAAIESPDMASRDK